MAMISTEELEGMNQVMFKQLKNRYNDPGKNKRFTVGIDRSKMRLYNISDPTLNISDNNSSSNNSKSPPVSKTPFGGRSRGSDFENKFTEFKV